MPDIRKIVFLSLFCSLLMFGYGTAEGQVLRFKRLTAEQGLSQSSVNCFLEDSRGYMWIGTEDGLNRYDGYEFSVFKNEPGNSNSLPDNSISAIVEDFKGNLWIGTRHEGLVKYDPVTKKFIRYLKHSDNFKGPPSKVITCIFRDSKNRIWIGTEDAGLSCYDPLSDQFKNFKYRSEKKKSLSSNHITSIAEDNAGNIWLGTPGYGLTCIQPETEKISRYFFCEGDSSRLMSPAIAGFFRLPGNQDVLCFLDSEGRFYRIDGLKKTYKQIYHRVSESLDREVSVLKDFSVNNKGEIWIGGRGSGLYVLKNGGNSLVNYSFEHRNPYSLSSNFISCFYQDRSGNIWIGTNGSGVNIYNPKSAGFKNFSQYVFDGESLPDNDIWSICGSGNELLLGTSSRGVLRFHPESGKAIEFPLPGIVFDKEGARFVVNVKQLSNGEIWAATRGDGIHIYNSKGKWQDVIHHNPIRGNSISGNTISSLIQSPTGSVWIAVKGKGIVRCYPGSRTFKVYPCEPDKKNALSNSDINVLATDRLGRILVGHADGVDVLDTLSEHFTKISRTSANKPGNKFDEVFTIFSDKSNLLWIGTSKGLCVQHPDGKMLIFREISGLPDDMVAGITQDQNGKIWFSSHKGIFRFEPPEAKLLVSAPGTFLAKIKNTLRNYDYTSGLNSNEFNLNAVFCNTDGKIYFGGPVGVSSFHPDSLADKFSENPVGLASFKVLGNEFIINPNDTVISLDYNQNYLSFDFLSINLLNAQPTRYAYMLSGFDKDWILSGNRRFASYTNLDPGEYTFRIKSSSGNRTWDIREFALKIKISKPFWKKGWFYFITITLFIGIIWVFIFFRERKLNSDKVRLEHLVEERTHELRNAKEQAENSMKAKEMFLSTMSHEIRTPLNAVIAVSQLLMDENPKPEQIENIETLRFSSENLLVLINDILDFSKIDAGKIDFEEAQINLRMLINGMRKALQPAADDKHIQLVVNISPQVPDIVIGDSVRLNQILTNLVSNGIKFTLKGTVRIEIDKEFTDDAHCDLKFSVIDTGIGIQKDKFERIFESFEQASNDTTRKFGGTGLGLTITKRLLELQGSKIGLESEVGKGSCFFFTLRFKRYQGKIENEVRKSQMHENALSGLRVLLVEDNSVNRLVATKFLEKWGVSISYAENGAIGVNMAHEQVFDLILMDLQMPEMDGFEATRAIRKMDQHWSGKVPILALTAAALMEVKEQVMEAGMNDYIAKPFNAEELFTKMAEHTGRLF
jgi:signal transduction histidine kinase/ligand-binding sensor domain-containing protein/CheY-like chemotaxis protein